MSTAKLPKGLPALPPVPEGFDAWEYAGKGPLVAEIKMGSYLWADKTWETPDECAGDAPYHYIRAIKRPAKLKKPKRAKAVKAVRGTFARLCAMPPIVKLADWTGEDQAPVFILPADAASVEAMVGQVAAELRGTFNTTFEQDARAVLASLGITSSKGRK